MKHEKIRRQQSGRFAALCCAFGFLCVPAFSQQDIWQTVQTPQYEGGSVVFAPYVTGLRAEVVGSSVVLTWHDSGSVGGPVFIYRSREPFYGGTTANQFQTLQTPYGVQSYTDTVPANGVWYYLAVASDDNNQRFEMVVPFNNMVEVFADGGAHSVGATSWSVQQTTPQIYSHAQAAEGTPNPAAFRNQALAYGNGGIGDSLPFVEMAQSPVNGITATAQGSDVLVQFMATNTGKNAVLYRAITPIRKFGDLLVATVVKLGVSSPHLDRVTPGVPYYYAVVFEEDLMNGQAVLSPGNNATLLPVETIRSPAAQMPATPAAQRYTPLTPPVPQTAPQGQTMGVTVIPGGAASAGRGGISTIRAPNSVVPQMYSPHNAHVPLAMEARVFNEDLQKPPAGTDEYELAQIVQRLVMWRSWNEARGALMKLLTDRPRKPAVDARAHFYLGQCAYFMGLYREAMAEFVAVQSHFPDEAAVWVQASLAKLK